MQNQDKSCNDWMFYINGYKNLYDPEATWANDWLDGGIKVRIDGEEKNLLLNLLIVEELEGFIDWMQNIIDKTSKQTFFQFLDTELCFEHTRTDYSQQLRMKYGLEKDFIFLVDLPISDNSMVVATKIEEIKELLSRFPCRCNLEHTLCK